MHHLDLSTIRLASGSHKDRDDCVCFLEAVAWWAEEEHSDAPQCVSPVLVNYGRRLNDHLPDDERQKLVPFIPRMVGTVNDGKDEARGLLAFDWLVRTCLPLLFRCVPSLVSHADALAACDPIRTRDDVRAIRPQMRAAAYDAAAARAARGAARGAAYAAYDAAAARDAYDAARGAAYAGYAAYDAAAAYAGYDAAYDAACDAAYAVGDGGDVDGVVVDVTYATAELRTGAIDLLDRMIDPT